MGFYDGNSSKCVLYVGVVYPKVLLPFFTKLFSLKFGENWNKNIPYDGYKNRKVDERDKFPEDILKADANKFMTYLVHLDKNNVEQYKNFRCWNEIKDKKLYLNFVERASKYRNEPSHLSGDKCLTDLEDVTPEKIENEVLMILKPFMDVKELRAGDGRSYYEIAKVDYASTKLSNWYAVNDVCKDLLDRGLDIPKNEVKSLLVKKGFSLTMDDYVIIPIYNYYISFLDDIKERYIPFSKIRSDLGAGFDRISDNDIKHICIKNQNCVGFCNESFAVFSNAQGYQKLLVQGTKRGKVKKKKGLKLFGAVTVLVCALVLVAGVFGMIALDVNKNTYKNDTLKTPKNGEVFTFNITKARYDGENLYLDFVVVNDGKKAVIDISKCVVTAKNSGGEIVFEASMDVENEVWEIPRDKGIIKKKISLDDESISTFEKYGTRDLFFEIEVGY